MVSIKPVKSFFCFFCFIIFNIFLLISCDDSNVPLEFPFDHGPHLDAQTEWWYFTGDVMSADGKRFGFECTIFKKFFANKRDFSFIGHVAVSDPQNAEHLFSETLTPSPVEGIEEGEADIKINDFSYVYLESKGFKVKGRGENIAVDVILVPREDVLLHGQDGVIVMGDGIPSYYYSHTNLATSGTITLNNVDYAIASGRTWMDHQWGNFTVLGLLWDWFSLRFDDGGSLMLFRFRDISGSTVRSNWTYRSTAGAITYGEMFDMQADRIYKGKTGQCSYPLEWIIEIPDINGVFSVNPLFDAQALYSDMLPDYWEGLCSVNGTIAGKQITGAAYAELTGYCK